MQAVLEKKLSVSAIKNGVVIDHIPAGYALSVIKLLQNTSKKQQITLGLNLISQKLKSKDLIKIENYQLNTEEINQISAFAPNGTINVIKEFNLFKKIHCQVPAKIYNILSCPNPQCISTLESKSLFCLEAYVQENIFFCYYCEKHFKLEELIK